jgi:hypothetical protein
MQLGSRLNSPLGSLPSLPRYSGAFFRRNKRTTNVIQNLLTRLLVTLYAYRYFKHKFSTELNNEQPQNASSGTHVTPTNGENQCSTATEETQRSSTTN